MIEAFIAVVALALIYEWRHAHNQDRFQAERMQWATERQTLLQRIQAPEQAVLEHAAQGRQDGSLYRTEFDDDMDHLRAVLEAE